MDYQKIYNQLIERAKNRNLEGYKEKHHILPKCLGGNNDKENLVELTAREHFLCHMLLCEIYPKENKLKQALWLMSIGKQKNKNNKYKPSSKTYERLKQMVPKIISSYNKGRKFTQEHKNKISQSNKGKKKIELKKRSQEYCDKISKLKTNFKHSDKTKLKMSNSKLGKTFSKEHKDKLSQAKIGINKNDKTKLKISIALKGRKRSSDHNNKFLKPILQYDLEGNFLKEWSSMKEATFSITKKYNSGLISECCNKKRETAYKYKWMFKNK